MSLHQFLLEPITCHAWNRDRTRPVCLDYCSLVRLPSVPIITKCTSIRRTGASG
ncbi:T0170891 isoform 2 [Pongo abelii]|uniref:T0170891 isoform 2 n=1 Tax=Pongo abelii TaxID=9601 RepID=A0A2J8RUB4_PONAB|nr:T0170891 isoform 2 [Pongo abelii]